MKLYKVLRDDVITNSWTSDYADETHYEDCFGLPERPELNEMGEPTGITLSAEYQIVTEDITAQLEQTKINQEALAYLLGTDWYVTRFAETGVPIPEDVKQKRQDARFKIKR